MNARPKRTDTEQDVLEMQKKFFEEKAKSKDFRPSTQVISCEKPKKQSLFAKSRNQQDAKIEAKLPGPKILLGDIVEKQTTTRTGVDLKPMQTDVVQTSGDNVSFPKIEKITIRESGGKKSLFALSMERKRSQATSSSNPPEIIDEPSVKTLKDNYGATSLLVDEGEVAKSIHEENLTFISQMKQEEILAEREELLKSLDPSLLKFIQEKRKQKLGIAAASPVQRTGNLRSIQEIPPQRHGEPKTVPMDVDASLESEEIEVEAVSELLKESEAEKWLHFGVVEKVKFEWMKEVPAQMAKLKPGETFEARFDWKGVLLPYTDLETNKDERELYLHGEEPHRPGYTLQELFRLGRSNIIQQRVSAFNAISGILNIYNQGFYDNVLDLPLSKIFFLLRFGLDENTPSILEAVSRSMANLLYNETDEVLLDIITETSEGYLQPMLGSEEKSTGNVENVFAKMKLTSTPFSTNVEDDDEDSKTSMNDFHLAETDLIECLLRTNIIQRIYYILGVVRAENSTVHSCLKMLIRIARTGHEACKQIATNRDLIKTLFEHFLPSFESVAMESDGSDFYNFPQYLVLKLFRIMISQHISFCISLQSYGLQDRIKSYLYNRQDIKTKLIKVQIESLRILRSMMLINMDGTLYRDLLPAFRYMLEWHYQHIVFNEGGPFLIRQHAAALLNAIFSGKTVDAVPILGEVLAMCGCKWFYEATKVGITEFSQSTILAAALNCISHFIIVNKSRYLDFISKYFRQFLQSKAFVGFIANLSRLSPLLKKSNDRRNIHQPLLNVGSITMSNDSPQLIISQKYPVFLLNSILNIIEKLHKHGDDLIVELINNVETIECFTNYLEKISKYVNRNLATSFLVKSDLRLAYRLLCFKPIREIMAKETMLQTTYNLVCCMTAEHVVEIERLFGEILFNSDNLEFDASMLTKWRDIFLETLVYPHRIVIPATEISLSMPSSQSPILPLDWPFLLLKTLLNKYLQQISESVQTDSIDIPEREIITVTLQFTDLLECNGLHITTPTEKLMYLMISFMGPNSEFLEPSMKILLQQTVRKFFAHSRNLKFQFNATFEGKSKFENLFVLFLDHFQAASYGDTTFSALLLVPLAQKYDNKWRKMVWSEHASVLRFLNCDEDDLLGGLDSYLQPIETEESLVKSYMQALNSNLLRTNTIPFKIAQHHVRHFTRQPVKQAE